jgi:hypothetical protein
MPLPETLTINGTEIKLTDNPELMKLVEVVRKEEKDKLYADKATLEAKVKDLENKAKETANLSAAEKLELENAKKEIGAKDQQLKDLKAAADAVAAKAKGKGKKKEGEDDDEGEDDEKPL